MEKRYKTFKEFYPFYLGEHRNRTCRILHYIGSSLGLSLLVFLLITGDYKYIPLCFVIGYAFAWIGHFVFEKNRPATFQYPLYSFMGDWIMLKDAIFRTRQID
jgi:hypothetical protein